MEMSDTDLFTDEGVVDEDPAAGFYARERDELAGLDDDGILTGGEPPLSTTAAGDQGITDDGFVDAIPRMNGPTDPSPPVPIPVPQQQQIREEPEKIKKWREQQQKALEEKDEEEARKKEELKVAAQRELTEWYARYKEQLEKSCINNRNAEKEWVAERDSEAPGQEWERIARLCDFNPKTTRNSKDTSRMRSIILQLKQTPLTKTTTPNNIM